MSTIFEDFHCGCSHAISREKVTMLKSSSGCSDPKNFTTEPVTLLGHGTVAGNSLRATSSSSRVTAKKSKGQKKGNRNKITALENLCAKTCPIRCNSAAASALVSDDDKLLEKLVGLVMDLSLRNEGRLLSWRDKKLFGFE